MPRLDHEGRRRAARRREIEAGDVCGVFGAFGMAYWEIPVEDAAWRLDEGPGLAPQGGEGDENGDHNGHDGQNPY